MRTLVPNKNEPYPYVRLWCRFMGSYEYYAEMQIERAKKTNAPKDAVYEKTGPGGEDLGVWVTLSEIGNERFKENVEYWQKHGRTEGDR